MEEIALTLRAKLLLSLNLLQLLTSAEQKHGDGLHSSINTYSLVN